MKTSIITVAYDKDLEFLKYNLKSIKKFCRGYHENVVVIDDHENDCLQTQKYLESIGQKYYINREAKFIKFGYVRQQYIKLHSHLYVSPETDYVCHVDSDSIFTKEHTPELYYFHNKPCLIKKTYAFIIEKIYQNELEHKKHGFSGQADLDVLAFKKWQSLTSKYSGIDVQYEYMGAMPLVYPVDVHKGVKEYLEKLHGMSLLDLLKDLDIISEFNLIGAIADKYYQDKFYWIDGKHHHYYKKYRYSLFDIFGHYSNRKHHQPARYIDLNDKNNPISQLLDS